MEQRRNLTLTQHWELHQGLWHMLGCDMKLIAKAKNTIRYVDNNTKMQYTYWAVGGKLNRRRL